MALGNFMLRIINLNHFQNDKTRSTAYQPVVQVSRVVKIYTYTVNPKESRERGKQK